jgi:putative endonuclease
MVKIFQFYVYILANAYNNVLYTGITNDIQRRCIEHKKKLIKGFTQRYNIDKLVYFESYSDVEEAINREKQIKGYSRRKKIALIEGFNKGWGELFENGKIHLPVR